MDLKDIRLSLGMSQREFGEALGVSRNYITLIEMGRRNPSAELLRDVSELVKSKEQVSKCANIIVDSGVVDRMTTKLSDLSERVSRVERLLLDILDRLPPRPGQS